MVILTLLLLHPPLLQASFPPQGESWAIFALLYHFVLLKWLEVLGGNAIGRLLSCLIQHKLNSTAYYDKLSPTLSR